MTKKDNQPLSNNEDTARAANAQGLLFKLSKEVTVNALYREKLKRMIEMKMGDLETEVEALEMVEGSRNERGKMKKEVGKGGRKGKKKIEYVKQNRDPKVVVDLLNLRLKYADREWKSSRRKYRKKKKEVSELFSGKKERKFRKMISRIGNNMKTAWRNGARKMQDKLEWIRRKFSLDTPPQCSRTGEGDL